MAESPRISKDTLIPIGLVLTMLGALFAGFQYLQNMRDESVRAQLQQREETRIALQSAAQSAAEASARLNDIVRDLKEDVRALRAEITNKTDDRWRKTDMRVFVLQLKALNPTITVPEIQ